MQRLAVTGVPIANDSPLRWARRSRYAGESEEHRDQRDEVVPEVDHVEDQPERSRPPLVRRRTGSQPTNDGPIPPVGEGGGTALR